MAADFNLSAAYPRTHPPGTLPAAPFCIELQVEEAALLAGRQEGYQAEGIRSLLCVPLTLHGQPAGTLTFYYRQPHRFAPADVRVAVALGRRAGAAITTAELYAQQQQLRAAAEAAQQRLAFLAEASRILASSLEYARTLEHVAQLAVPRLADWCTIHVVEEDGSVRQVA